MSKAGLFFLKIVYGNYCNSNFYLILYKNLFFKKKSRAWNYELAL